jgi:hypothetical protein
MSNIHLHCNPHAVKGDKTAWWYEEPKGICVVQEFYDDAGGTLATRFVTIPWASIRGALARKDRKP